MLHKMEVYEICNAYLGLGTAATDGINPDVLSLDMAALVQRHVLHKLFAVSIYG